MMTLNSKKPIAKKRGRPLGSKNKNKRVRKVAGKEYTFKDKAFKQVDEKFRSIPKVPPIPARVLVDKMYEDQEVKILNLEHQIIGYKAVISYLEHMLGKK
jgi:hypothetical protein